MPPPGDLPHPGTEPTSLTSPALAGGFFTTSTTWEVIVFPENKKCESCPTLFINLTITLIPKLEKRGKKWSNDQRERNKAIELLRKFNKISRYQNKLQQKSIAFFHTNNNQLETIIEIKTPRETASYTLFRNVYVNCFVGFFWPGSSACGILVPLPGTEPMAPAVKAWSLNHWITMENPCNLF